MTKATETNVLRRLLRQLDGRAKSFLHAHWFAVLLWPVVALFFLVLFQLETKIGAFGIAIGSMLVGAVVATVAIYRSSYEQWAVTSCFLDREAIANRLRELEP